jgi:phage terminase Nu1 subunit (DNA packaging protein)
MKPERLDSWKEIAAYLNRDQRTVQRWETQCGMPVHRIPGRVRSTVYAFPMEIDAWLRGEAIPSAITAGAANQASLFPSLLCPNQLRNTG